jgi:GxxExxY protein
MSPKLCNTASWIERGLEMIFTTGDTEDTEPEGKKVDRISGAVIGCAIEVHRVVGPGLLESAYEICLAQELDLRGHEVARQRQMPVIYRGIQVDSGYRLDLVVDDLVIVELKAVECLLPIHSAQLLSHLRLSGLPLALLINFNVGPLKQGIRRLKPFPSVSVSSVVQPVDKQGE